MSAILEIEDLHFSYGDQAILKGVTLTVQQGQVVGILGTSGSGKSTLLRLIGGQLRPSKGCVRFMGKVVHEQTSAGLYQLRREMGMMFQAGGLFSDLNVLDNVAFALREHTQLHPDLIELTALMKLESVGLRGAAQLMPSELSGGMARRVALARAIAMDPPLNIYDEPFAGLDPISLNAVANLIRRLNDALGSTSIVVTYDVTESLKVADQLFLLAEGQVVVHGSPTMMEESVNPYAAQFMHAQAEGPVPFHVPAPSLTSELELFTSSGI